jgi:uncharacterized membrane-anchored protein
MSISLLFFSVFCFIAMDGGVGVRMLVLAVISAVMFTMRYWLNKQHRS